jgi:hypothetical protein
VNKRLPADSFAADTAKFLEQFTSLSRVALLHTKKAVKEAAGGPSTRRCSTSSRSTCKDLMATEDASRRTELLHGKAQAGLEEQIILRSMDMIPSTIKTWQMTVAGTLTRTEIPVPALQPRRSPGRSPGCGVCHTDLSYFYMGVRTDHPPPLSLGHEISGVVVAGEASYDRQGSHHSRRAPLQQVRAVQDRARQPLPRAEDAGQFDGHLRRLLQPHSGAGG